MFNIFPWMKKQLYSTDPIDSVVRYLKYQDLLKSGKLKLGDIIYNYPYPKVQTVRDLQQHHAKDIIDEFEGKIKKNNEEIGKLSTSIEILEKKAPRERKEDTELKEKKQKREELINENKNYENVIDELKKLKPDDPGIIGIYDLPGSAIYPNVPLYPKRPIDFILKSARMKPQYIQPLPSHFPLDPSKYYVIFNKFHNPDLFRISTRGFPQIQFGGGEDFYKLMKYKAKYIFKKNEVNEQNLLRDV